MQIRTILLAVLVPSLLASMPALAQSVSEFDWRSSATVLAEPWEANTRTFANGEIRLAVMDTIEPAAGSYHMMILSPPYDEYGARQCRILSLNDGLGYAGFNLGAGTASYDPSQGLTVFVPTTVWSDGDQYFDTILSITINAASGNIWAQLQ